MHPQLLIYHSVDDAFLQQAASSIPKKAIFLIEDIDCAFATANRMGDAIGVESPPGHAFGSGFMPASGFSTGIDFAMPPLKRSSVTLSGLLNVIDGIGSEEGVLFFATVSVSNQVIKRITGRTCFPLSDQLH